MVFIKASLRRGCYPALSKGNVIHSRMNFYAHKRLTDENAKMVLLYFCDKMPSGMEPH